MKSHFSKIGLAAAIGVLVAGSAFATPIEMTLSSGTKSGSGFNLTSSFVVYSTGSKYSFKGWDVNLVGGFSNSPSLSPFALDLQSLTAACGIRTGCAPLTVSISDIGYMTPVGPNGLLTQLSDTQTGKGSVSQWAYIGFNNAYFQKDSLIGTLTLSGTGGASIYGGAGANAPYSLTLIDTFTTSCTSKGCTSFSTDGDITSAPEPGTLALFGGGLLGCALFVGRRRRSQSR